MLINYLYNNCNLSDSFLRLDEGVLIFTFDSLSVYCEINIPDKETINIDEDDFEIGIHVDYFSLINIDVKDIESLAITDVFLYHSIQTLHIEEDGFDLSISNLMYQYVSLINNKYTSAISNYYNEEILVSDGGGMCPDVFDYCFKIHIEKEFQGNIDFFYYILNDRVTKVTYFDIPNFYNTYRKINDSFEISILSSNTKIRRLGYLKLLLKMLSESPKVPMAQINFRFEKYCQNYNDYLIIYKNQKGNIIETKTGNSAAPYIELAFALELIRNSAGICEVGKLGLVYNILKRKIDDNIVNPFVLSKFDASFFLEMLLKKDFVFLYAIMEQAVIHNKTSFNILRKSFKQIITNHFTQFIEIAKIENHSKVIQLKMVEKRISEWKKPEVYLEHVLMPRLNWLYDLNLIDLKYDLSFDLTDEGKKLFSNFSVWNDINQRRVISPESFIDRYFLNVFNVVFNLEKPIKSSNINEEFKNCINEGFELFKTLAPNRITFSLFASYTKHYLFWNDIGILDTGVLRQFFESKNNTEFIFRYQDQYKDGYIQIKK